MLKRGSTSQITLAPDLENCFAKTWMDRSGKKLLGRTVLNHTQIVGEIARTLLMRQPRWLVESLFPVGSVLVAAAHDIGKVSPTFQEKILRGTSDYIWNSKTGLEQVDPTLEHNWGGHAGLSQLTADELKLGKFIPEILGQHHGYTPVVGSRLATDSVFGGDLWQMRRAELVKALQTALQTNFPVITDLLHARLLAGLTAVADWIGSGSLFDDPTVDWQPLIDQALDQAGFVKPDFVADLSFTDIFDGKQLRDSQASFIECVTGPGLYILEAPMGLGKTEAALYAAYQLMSQGQASGLYFALPTQLTSDKIHDRVALFLNRILHPQSPHRQALLLHGNAWLKTLELGKEGNPGGSWFQGGKRGILAPFAVGTIDQALMAVMNVKHGFVRTFGLAGKVVILDEVHSYDSYTGTILDELVKALRQLHCTVIVLSATLTRDRRQALTGLPAAAEEYPLISALPWQGELIEQPAAALPDNRVQLRIAGDTEALEQALLRAEQGQQVLWIENTVADAQACFKQLASRSANIGVECGILHSRFSKLDRQRNEALWTTHFGQEGHASRNRCGRILVGTQVLEQSLDIDADFLVSRFAPSDMLLQRLGRLWRHVDTPRSSGATQEAWLLAPDLESAINEPERAFSKSAKVYSPYVLCRSLEVWQFLPSIDLPGQIRQVIEQTYAPRQEQGVMLKYFNLLEAERQVLQRLALLGVSFGVETLPEEKASTRYGEQDSVEVLLVKNYCTDKTDGLIVMLLPDDSKLVLPTLGKGLTPSQRRELAAQLLQHTVRVAEYLAPSPVAAERLRGLQGYLYLGKADKGESPLRIAKLMDSGDLVALDGGPALPGYALAYDHFGYRAEKL
ncbi:CRISPR-associated helicase Cas3' [Methylomonas albis]|uniref:CRISPR-associated helicase Cas3 n=1 Tax=Methylomonas albis TaxID=1854563 RepID=A0ABR9D407_9GAMM|nr:CRISPR-associated helicase Cas3' [Methylomonas albis]MBD9357841.1 CRISPR-associated helicase Cas3' [Methylomonas albis]